MSPMPHEICSSHWPLKLWLHIQIRSKKNIPNLRLYRLVSYQRLTNPKENKIRPLRQTPKRTIRQNPTRRLLTPTIKTAISPIKRHIRFLTKQKASQTRKNNAWIIEIILQIKTIKKYDSTSPSQYSLRSFEGIINRIQTIKKEND